MNLISIPRFVSTQLLTVGACLLLGTVSGQPVPHGGANSLDTGTYPRILDEVLPIGVQHAPDEVFSLTFRVLSSGRPEEQISLSLTRGKDGIAEHAAAEENIEHRVNEALQRGGATVATLAQSIHVRRERAVIPAQVMLRWQRMFLSSFDGVTQALQSTSTNFYKTGFAEVALDGDTCVIWYTQGLAHVQVHITDSDAYGPGSSLRHWVANLRAELTQVIRQSEVRQH